MRAARLLVPARHRPAVAGMIRSLGRRGTAVQCNCCGGRWDRFIPHNEREHAKCPRCGSLERHRLLLVFLQGRTNLFSEPLAVLHVAPEYALTRRLWSCSNLDYVTVDLDSPLADDHADLISLPYREHRFDVVICSHVLEHVEDDRAALSEIYRVLKPRGKAILMSPIDQNLPRTYEDPGLTAPGDRQLAFGQSDHVRRYGLDFAERVAAAGFEVETLCYLDEIPPHQIDRLGLRRVSQVFQHDDIFVCIRPD